VLTVDLTNRCNMMCDPCFMDANQVGFVHELTWEDITQVLDNAVSMQAEAADVGAVLRRRADAVALLPRRHPLRPQGRLHLGAMPPPTASSSPRAPSSPRRPGRRRACASPTCSSTASATPPTRTGGSRNLFDVKLQRDRAPPRRRRGNRSSVITIVNGVNNEQVGPHRCEFAARQRRRRSTVLSFQPVSFTGRDEAISPERAAPPNATRCRHLAHDVAEPDGYG
jgi:hypothetical protein